MRKRFKNRVKGTVNAVALGGVCCFALSSFHDAIVPIYESHNAERIWHIIHSNCGPFLFGIQYRPPAPGEIYH